MTHLQKPSMGNDWLPADDISEALATRGFIVLPDIIPEPIREELLATVKITQPTLRPAAIGRGEDEHQNQFVRRDRIAWLDPATSALNGWFAGLECLREGLNKRLFLGLWDFECHLAHYQAGAFYKRHVDAFRGRSNRRVSLVAYLNSGWSPEQGGELVLYTQPGLDDQGAVRVTPLMGTLVLFLSEDIPHEVLPVTRDRFSVAGWFRVNDTTGQRLDPAT